MQTCTVPRAGNGLGGEGYFGTKLFGDAVEEETSHPEVITHCDVGLVCEMGCMRVKNIQSIPSQGPI